MNNLYGDSYLKRIKQETEEMPMYVLEEVSKLIKKRRNKHTLEVRLLAKEAEDIEIEEVKGILAKVRPLFKDLPQVVCKGCHSYGDGYADCSNNHPKLYTCKIARDIILKMFTKEL